MKFTRNSALALALTVVAFAAPGAQAAEPLALQKIMKDLGRNMQDISDGIPLGDWELVENTASLIADHPEPPFFEKIRIINFAGTNIGKYKAYNAAIHDHAQIAGKAAKNKDGPAVIVAFQNLQASCDNCHNEFRKPFVEHFYGKKDSPQ